MTAEATGKSWKWVIALLLLSVVGFLFYSVPPRDKGRMLRRAAYRGELRSVERLLTEQPDLVNATNAVLSLSQNSNPRQNQSMNFMDNLTLELWRGMTGIRANGDYDEFQYLEDMQAPPLHYAVSTGRNEVADYLLKHGANIHQTDRMKMTVTHQAAMRQPAMLRMLLDHKAPLNATNAFQQTPLMISVGRRETVGLEILLEYGADPNLPARLGWYPLHSAASMRSTNALVILLAHGARLDVTNNAGQTPLDMAISRRATNVVMILQAYKP